MTSANKVWVQCVNMPLDAFKVSIDDVIDVDDLKKAITEETIRRNRPISVSHIVDTANQAYDVKTLVIEIFADLDHRTAYFTTCKCLF